MRQPTAPQRVVVVGSVNQDIVLSVPALPTAGETVLAFSGSLTTGGKGANQAVAAARAGAFTEFVGAFGADAAAEDLHQAVAAEGVNLVRAAWSTKPSGRAIVLVDSAGDNCIVVDQGANADVTAAHVSNALASLHAGDVVIVQCEVNGEAVESALTTGAARGATVLLNLAPYRILPSSALRCASVIVVNEGEAAALAGTSLPLDDGELTARAIAAAHHCACVVTLGERGSVVAEDATRSHVVPAVPVENVVDTTGAGDAFVGVLGAALAAGRDLVAAVRSATRAAAHTVQALGAQTSPILAELDDAVVVVEPL